MRIAKLCFHLAFSLCTLLVLALAVVLFVTTRKVPLAGIHSFSILSGSMAPAYPVGDVVFTRPQEQYELDDVIAFTRGGETVTHRVVSFQSRDGKRYYVVKGDANDGSDSGKVPEDSVIGKVFFALPYLGKMIALLHTPLGALALIGVPTLMLVLHEIWIIKTEFEGMIEKKVRKKMEKEVEATIRKYMSLSQTAHG